MTIPIISVQGVSAIMVATSGIRAIVSLLRFAISSATLEEAFNLHPQESAHFGNSSTRGLNAGIGHIGHGVANFFGVDRVGMESTPRERIGSSRKSNG